MKVKGRVFREMEKRKEGRRVVDVCAAGSDLACDQRMERDRKKGRW
jgi:hypothetical protein